MPNDVLLSTVNQEKDMQREAKDKRIMVRLSGSQFKKLVRVAAKYDMRPSTYLRFLFNSKGK